MGAWWAEQAEWVQACVECDKCYAVDAVVTKGPVVL
jgi:hypothetical protein